MAFSTVEPVAQITDLFIRNKRHLYGVSERTVEWYKQAFKTFEPARLNELDDGVVERVKNRIIELSEQGRKPVSINCHLRVIRAYLKWAKKEGRITGKVKLRPVKEPDAIIEIWRPEHIRLLLAARPRTSAGKQARVIALMILDCGLRITEAISLRRGAIDLDNLLVAVYRGKGNKGRIVPISHACRVMLVKHMATHTSDLVFCNRDGLGLQRRDALHTFARVCSGAGIKGIRTGWHILRHTFATNFIVAGGNVLSLQRILGHRTLEMTKKYVRMNVEDLKDQHDRYSLLLKGTR